MLSTQLVRLNDHLNLRSLSGKPIVLDVDPSRPGLFCIYEWNDYAIEWNESSRQFGQIRLGGLVPSTYRSLQGAAIFSFQNQLGRARLQILARNEPSIPVELEVLSQKFPTMEAHERLLQTMLGALSERAAALPFSIEAPTAFPVGESLRPRSDLFSMYFLAQEGLRILEALEVVLREPRRLLTMEDRVSRIDQVARLDVNALFDAVSGDSALMPVRPTQPAYDLRIAQGLRIASNAASFLPVEIYESRAEETLDSPEHRFIRAFIDELLEVVSKVSRFPLSKQRGDELHSLHGPLQEAVQSSFLSEVGRMVSMPSSSRVLLQAHGYRDLLQAWRLFQVASDPFGSLDKAIDARDIATLYEWWCFFIMVHELEVYLGTPKVALKCSAIDDLYGLREGIRVSFGEGWELLYNQGFARSDPNWTSYSVGLRPDFVIVNHGEPVIGLDAKFRFDVADWTVTSETPDEEPQSLSSGGALLRLAKQADIYKMHTYRDALGLRSSIALYPGNTSTFYSAMGQSPQAMSLAQLFDNPNLQGVGAIALAPETYNW